MLRFLLLLSAALALSACARTDDEAALTGSRESVDSVAFAYTTLDYEACETLVEYENGMGIELRCPGLGDVPLFVTEGDLRMDVDAGLPNEVWTSLSPFNSLGETVEWRLRGDKPFAVIVRYHLDDEGGVSVPSRLAVISVGTEGNPGCLVGWIDADASPDQNTAARDLADREAEGFDCWAVN